MNSTDVDIISDGTEENRILWVGNIHPKVTSKNIAELFYQVGPIEYVQLIAADGRKTYENIAWVLFKHSSSVYYSIKIFRGTKLYGLPIITKKLSKYLGNLTVHEQLNYFKLLENDKLSKQLNNIHKNRWIDNNSDNNQDSTRKSYMNNKHNTNKNSYDYLISDFTGHDCGNKHATQKHCNLFTNNHNPIDNYNHRHELSRISEYYGKYSSKKLSMNNQDLHHSENIDCICQDNNVHVLHNRKEKMHHNKKFPFINENYFVNDVLPKCNIKDGIFQKYYSLISNNYSKANHNADILKNNKSRKYEDLQQHYEMGHNNQGSDRINKNTHGGSIRSYRDSHTKNYTSMQYNDSNKIDRNHYTNRIYSREDSLKNFQKYDGVHSNNIHNKYYNLEKNVPKSYKYDRIDAQNMKLSSLQQNVCCQFKRNDIGHERKGYNYSYDYKNGPNCYKRDSNRSRQNN